MRSRASLVYGVARFNGSLKGLMSPLDDPSIAILRLITVVLLVFANGFFVAAEFSLVAVRRSRVAELMAERRANAAALQAALDNLDSYLAATQLGITISSLGLGWLGEPAIANLIEPLLAGLPGGWASVWAHTIAVIIAFTLITALHIVLGELAPKSLALQRSEQTALLTVRPLGLFLIVFHPAILSLNRLGIAVLRLFGLSGDATEETLHSPQELKLLVSASREAGLLQPTQEDVVERILNIGERPIGDIMTPRPNIQWIDADGAPDAMLRTVRDSPHEQLMVGRKDADNVVGMVLKRDLLDQALDGKALDPLAVIRQPLVVHETKPVLKVLEQFKQQPVRLAIVVDEYGALQGLVTQTDLLEAIAGDLANATDGTPEVVEREDGSLLMDGRMPAVEAFARLRISDWPKDADFHTIAGFALMQLERIPGPGDWFEWSGWRFEIMDMDGRRIDKLMIARQPNA